MSFNNQIALVTGSSRGIGAATALEFARRGAKVVVHYHENKTAAQEVVAKIGQDNCLLVQADVTQEDEVKALVNQVIEKFNRVDILVNNAGAILRPGDWQSDLKSFQKTLDTNLTSTWLMIKTVAPHMQKAGRGSIVNLASTVGILGSAPVLAYGASKGGIITLTKAMAKALAPDIRVNAVAPSNVMTNMTLGAGKELIERMRQNTPLQRIADPKELAKPIVFLCSKDASYITGEVLVVDGGYTLK